MSEQKSSNSSKGLGNTKTKPKRQISPAKRWCFTVNNYDSTIINEIKDKVPIMRCIIVGKEIGEKGTPHLQGYFEFHKKRRPLSVFKSKKYHFEKAKGSKEDNEAYCEKEGKVILRKGFDAKLKLINREDFYNYQEEIVKLIDNDYDNRTINWFWETKGNVGKSALCKWLCAKRGGIMLSNKATDMKNMILMYKKNTGLFPELIIIDIPRSVNLDYLSYTGIEEVKNGCFFSPKYEGGQVLMNSPTILIFSNELPEIEKMSKDRWNIKKIKIGKSERKAFFSSSKKNDSLQS